jgi:hypothetical protein
MIESGFVGFSACFVSTAGCSPGGRRDAALLAGALAALVREELDVGGQNIRRGLVETTVGALGAAEELEG